MDSIAPEPNIPGLSRYRIEKQIGSGGGGRVFKAWDEKLQRVVALKRIDKAALPDGHSASQEALHLSSLHHPNIVTVHDFGEDEEGPFVVLEYVDGEALTEMIQRGALPLEEFSLLAQQSLDALSAAHAQGLLHRDLKPDNLMVHWLPNGGFQVKVLDFGLAKIVAVPQAATCQHDGTYVGTIYTMAPEALQKAPVDVRSDLYSLGCVFYYALTQHMPFTGETISDVVVSHLQHQVVPLERYRPDLPPVIVQWVHQFIETDPGQRFHSAKQALAVFARLLQQQRNEAGAPASAVKSERAAARAPEAAPPKGVSWMAWAAGLLLIAGVGIWYGLGAFKKAPEPVAIAATPATRSPAVATPRPVGSGLPDANAIAALGQSSPVASATPAPIPPPEPVVAPPGAAPAAPEATAPPAPMATPAPVAPMTPAAPLPPGSVLVQATNLPEAKTHIGSDIVLEGSVLSLSHNKTGDIHYLNFDRNYRNAVSLVFFASKNPAEFSPEKLQTFVGKHIRVRGALEEYKENLQIKVKGLNQIEIVN